jgi:hypothetical protein
LLTNSDGEQTGKIKMTFKMEAVNEVVKQQLLSPEPSASFGVTPLLLSAFPCFINIGAVRGFEIPWSGDSIDFNSRPLSAVGGRPASACIVKSHLLPSLTLRLHCDGFYQSVEVNVYYTLAYQFIFFVYQARTIDGEFFDFPSLRWTFPLSSEDTMIKVMLLNRSSDGNISNKTSNSGEVIATLAFKAKQLHDPKTTSLSNQCRLSTFSMLSHKKGSKGAVYGGKLLFEYDISSSFQPVSSAHRTSSTSDAFLPPLSNTDNSRRYEQMLQQPPVQQSNLLDQKMSIARKDFGVRTVNDSSILSHPYLRNLYSNRADESPQWNSGVTSGMALEDGISPQFEPSSLMKQPLIRIALRGISTIDLPSIHRFKVNSPVCTVACGKFSYTTKVSENTGSFANWDNIGLKDKANGEKGKRARGLTIAVDQHSQLRFLVSSWSDTIGQCSLSGKKLCCATKTEDDKFVVSFSVVLPEFLILFACRFTKICKTMGKKQERSS